MLFRRQGSYSPEIREIILELGDIPQATVQGWVADVELTTEQRQRIKQKEIDGAARGQPLGALWNREQKQKRLQVAKDQAIPIAKRLARISQCVDADGSRVVYWRGRESGRPILL